MASLRVCATNVRYEIYVAGGIALTTIAIVIWFVIMVQASYIPSARAVTPQQAGTCLAMPRGNQVLENMRKACSNELYGSGRFKQL